MLLLLQYIQYFTVYILKGGAVLTQLNCLINFFCCWLLFFRNFSFFKKREDTRDVEMFHLLCPIILQHYVLSISGLKSNSFFFLFFSFFFFCFCGIFFESISGSKITSTKSDDTRFDPPFNKYRRYHKQKKTIKKIKNI